MDILQQPVLSLIMRLLEANLTPIAKASECEADIPHLLYLALLGRFDNVSMLRISLHIIARSAGHKKKILNILECGFECLRTLVVCNAEYQALRFESGAVVLGPRGRDDGRGWYVVLM